MHISNSHNRHSNSPARVLSGKEKAEVLDRKVSDLRRRSRLRKLHSFEESRARDSQNRLNKIYARFQRTDKERTHKNSIRRAKSSVLPINHDPIVEKPELARKSLSQTEVPISIDLTGEEDSTESSTIDLTLSESPKKDMPKNAKHNTTTMTKTQPDNVSQSSSTGSISTLTQEENQNIRQVPSSADGNRKKKQILLDADDVIVSTSSSSINASGSQTISGDKILATSSQKKEVNKPRDIVVLDGEDSTKHSKKTSKSHSMHLRLHSKSKHRSKIGTPSPRLKLRISAVASASPLIPTGKRPEGFTGSPVTKKSKSKRKRKRKASRTRTVSKKAKKMTTTIDAPEPTNSKPLFNSTPKKSSQQLNSSKSNPFTTPSPIKLVDSSSDHAHSSPGNSSPGDSSQEEFFDLPSSPSSADDWPQETTTPNSSTKRVAFSSDLESSPAPSSPVKEPRQPRSILKNSGQPSPIRHGTPLEFIRRDLTKDSSWPDGHVIQLSVGSNGIDHLVKGCVGALENSEFTKRYEVFASLNEIVRVNGRQQARSYFNQQQLHVVARAADAALVVSSRELRRGSDPFRVRTAIQALKLLAFVLGCHRARGANTIMTRAADMLRSANLSKGLAVATLLLFKDNQNAISSSTVETILASILQMKRFASPTVTTEKLAVVRRLITTHPAVMAKLSYQWLSWVLCRVLDTEAAGYERVVNTCIYVLYDFARCDESKDAVERILNEPVGKRSSNSRKHRSGKSRRNHDKGSQSQTDGDEYATETDAVDLPDGSLLDKDHMEDLHAGSRRSQESQSSLSSGDTAIADSLSPAVAASLTSSNSGANSATGPTVADALTLTLVYLINRGWSAQALDVWTYLTFMLGLRCAGHLDFDDWPGLGHWFKVIDEALSSHAPSVQSAALNSWRAVIFNYQSSPSFSKHMSKDCFDRKRCVFLYPFSRFPQNRKSSPTVIAGYVMLYHRLVRFLRGLCISPAPKKYVNSEWVLEAIFSPFYTLFLKRDDFLATGVRLLLAILQFKLRPTVKSVDSALDCFTKTSPDGWTLSCLPKQLLSEHYTAFYDLVSFLLFNEHLEIRFKVMVFDDLIVALQECTTNGAFPPEAANGFLKLTDTYLRQLMLATSAEKSHRPQIPYLVGLISRSRRIFGMGTLTGTLPENNIVSLVGAFVYHWYHSEGVKYFLHQLFGTIPNKFSSIIMGFAILHDSTIDKTLLEFISQSSFPMKIFFSESDGWKQVFSILELDTKHFQVLVDKVLQLMHNSHNQPTPYKDVRRLVNILCSPGNPGQMPLESSELLLWNYIKAVPNPSDEAFEPLSDVLLDFANHASLSQLCSFIDRISGAYIPFTWFTALLRCSKQLALSEPKGEFKEVETWLSKNVKKYTKVQYSEICLLVRGSRFEDVITEKSKVSLTTDSGRHLNDAVEASKIATKATAPATKSATKHKLELQKEGVVKRSKPSEQLVKTVVSKLKHTPDVEPASKSAINLGSSLNSAPQKTKKTIANTPQEKGNDKSVGPNSKQMGRPFANGIKNSDKKPVETEKPPQDHDSTSKAKSLKDSAESKSNNVQAGRYPYQGGFYGLMPYLQANSLSGQQGLPGTTAEPSNRSPPAPGIAPYGYPYSPFLVPPPYGFGMIPQQMTSSVCSGSSKDRPATSVTEFEQAMQKLRGNLTDVKKLNSKEQAALEDQILELLLAMRRVRAIILPKEK